MQRGVSLEEGPFSFLSGSSLLVSVSTPASMAASLRSPCSNASPPGSWLHPVGYASVDLARPVSRIAWLLELSLEPIKQKPSRSQHSSLYLICIIFISDHSMSRRRARPLLHVSYALIPPGASSVLSNAGAHDSEDVGEPSC